MTLNVCDEFWIWRKCRSVKVSYVGRNRGWHKWRCEDGSTFSTNGLPTYFVNRLPCLVSVLVSATYYAESARKPVKGFRSTTARRYRAVGKYTDDAHAAAMELAGMLGGRHSSRLLGVKELW